MSQVFDRRALIASAAATTLAMSTRLPAQALTVSTRSARILDVARREVARAGNVLWRRDIAGIADFSAHSSQPRLHFANLEAGTVTIELTRRHVAEIVTVTEDEIAHAIAFLSNEHGVVAEGSAAVGVAALLHAKVTADEPTAVLVTGRNIARPTYVDVLTRATDGPPRR